MNVRRVRETVSDLSAEVEPAVIPPAHPPVQREPPELLSPAGDWDAMRAAVANGADAVYFGLSDFNARHRATNFTVEELPQVMEFLHNHNVRGYVTCNTLIFSEELPQLVDYCLALALAGADAIIVQDIGLARLMQRAAPHLHVHASTQMTLTESRGIELIRSLGIQRAILARELSLKDIAHITRHTTMPVEVFVHGALCVAYSGQCLTSESLGGRSANRGQCAQACRLPYDLIVDGEDRPLGDLAYLLSPQDLAAPELIDELVREGVSCFKIEGRLKSAHYVAATTQTYRTALDAALDGQQFQLGREQSLALSQSFSRGFTHGFLDGVNHQRLVQGRFPKSRGVRVGQVVGRTQRGVIVELGEPLATMYREQPGEPPIRPGDGVVFDEGHPEQEEQGGRLFEVAPCADPRTNSNSAVCVELAFRTGDVALSAIAPTALVWKTDDPQFRKRMENSFSRDLVTHRVPIAVSVELAAGSPLRLTLQEGATRVVVTGEQPLAAAKNRPLVLSWLQGQLDRLGDTPFELGPVSLWHAGIAVTDETPVPVMVPASLLNELRRQGIQQLLEARQTPRTARDLQPLALRDLRAELEQRHPQTVPATPRPAHLHVLVRTMEQLQLVLAWKPETDCTTLASVACDFEDPRRYQGAVDYCRDAGVPVRLATLRIVKPNEEGWLRQVGQAAPDVILIRSLAALHYYRERFPTATLWGDYSLNVSNELTADWFLGQGLQRLVPSYDLNWQQLTSFLGQINPAVFETVIHQHMPMFHMEHCVFCHTLSTGTDYRDCGRPCETHQVELRDRVGEAHPLLADVGCRNTVFNAHAQSAAEYVPRMRELGLEHFRIELVRETGAELTDLLTRYSRLLSGKEAGREAWRSLQVLHQLGVTRGPLDFA